MSRAADYLAGKTDRRNLVRTDGSDEALRSRSERILVAGALNDREVLALLGSAESCKWYDGRSLADPAFVNPYWGSRR